MGYKSDIEKVVRVQAASNFPKVILIDNCNACNLRCSMCDHINMKKHRKVQLMDFHLHQKIIDEIAVENPSARIWQIFFGDPFMCHDIAKRIQYAKDKALTDVVLNSNGVLMTPRKAKAVIQAGLDVMYVGIDAATEKTYNQIRVGGDFGKAVKNVLNYRDLLKEVGRPEQKLYVQFVISDINENEAEDFQQFWVDQGINVKIRPKISWAGLIEADNLQDNTMVARKPCYWLMQTMNICADGRVALCSVDIHCRVECGNVQDTSLKELWQGLLREYRTMHQECRFEDLPEMCRGCSDWQSAYADFTMSKK
jgi:MoaA/NifB/PqqE/SkfB family radical SAM enzyme